MGNGWVVVGLEISVSGLVEYPLFSAEKRLTEPSSRPISRSKSPSRSQSTTKGLLFCPAAIAEIGLCVCSLKLGLDLSPVFASASIPNSTPGILAGATGGTSAAGIQLVEIFWQVSPWAGAIAETLRPTANS
ncbi:MAG: hypothetical protein VKK42_26710 [Lyngbya sp.]|nr:hypothetical protein [Lyngbya sp.]